MIQNKNHLPDGVRQNITRKLLLFGATLLIATPSFAAKPPKNIISMDRAKEIAAKASPGEIKSSEIEFEKKQWVYSFDIAGSDNQIHEVLVNAKTGKIVSNSVESASQEQAEKNTEGGK